LQIFENIKMQRESQRLAVQCIVLSQMHSKELPDHRNEFRMAKDLGSTMEPCLQTNLTKWVQLHCCLLAPKLSAFAGLI